MEYRHSSHGYITIKYTQNHRLNQEDQGELFVLKNTFKKQLTEIEKRLRQSTWNKIEDDQDIRRVILQLFRSFYYQIKQERNKTKSQKRDHSINNETFSNKQPFSNKQTENIFHKTILKNQFLLQYLGALDRNQFSEAQQLTKNPRYTEFTRNNDFFTRFDLKLLEYQQIRKLKFKMQKLNQNNTCYEDILLNIDKSYFLQQKIDIPENRKIIERLNTQLYYKIQQNCLQTKKIDQYSKVISRYSSIITRLNQKLKSYSYSNAQLKQILKTSTLFQNSFKQINIEDCNKQLQDLLNNLYQKQTKCILNQDQKEILKQSTIQEIIHLILKYFCSILSSQSNQNRIRKFKEFSKNLQNSYKDNKQIKDSLFSIEDIFQKTKCYEQLIDQILKIKSVSLIQKNKTLFKQIDYLPYSDIKKKLKDIYQRNIMSVLVKENIQSSITNEQKSLISQIPKQIQGLFSQKIRSILKYIKKKDQNQNFLLTSTKSKLHQAYKLVLKKQYKQRKSWGVKPVIQDINRCAQILLQQVRVFDVKKTDRTNSIRYLKTKIKPLFKNVVLQIPHTVFQQSNDNEDFLISQMELIRINIKEICQKNQSLQNQIHFIKAQSKNRQQKLSNLQQTTEKLNKEIQEKKDQCQRLILQNEQLKKKKRQLRSFSINQKKQDKNISLKEVCYYQAKLNQMNQCLQNVKKESIQWKVKYTTIDLDFSQQKMVNEFLRQKNKVLKTQFLLIEKKYQKFNHLKDFDIEDLIKQNQKLNIKQQKYKLKQKQLEQKVRLQCQKRVKLNEQIQNLKKQKSNMELTIKTERINQNDSTSQNIFIYKLQIGKLKKQLQVQQMKYQNYVKSNETKIIFLDGQVSKLKSQVTLEKQKSENVMSQKEVLNYQCQIQQYE